MFEREYLQNFELKFDFLERQKKLLTLALEYEKTPTKSNSKTMINISFQFVRKTAARIKKEVSHKLPVH